MVYDARPSGKRIRRQREIAVALVDEVVVWLFFVGTSEIWAGECGVGRRGHCKTPLHFFAGGDFMLLRTGGTDAPVLSVGGLYVDAFDRQIFRALVVDLRFDCKRLAWDRDCECGSTPSS